MNMKPDTMTLAKAITSAYFPVSAVLIPEKMYAAMIDESKKIGVFAHGYTYSGHPVGAAIGVKTLEIYARDKIFEKAAAKIPTFWKRLDTLRDHPLVGEVRGKGLVAGLELVADKSTKRAFDAKAAVGAKATMMLQDEGLIVRNLGDTIAVCPPLVITEAEIEDLFDRMTRGLDRTEALVREHALRG
jgi:4-aminobutyrate--pyruvate transaminase